MYPQSVCTSGCKVILVAFNQFFAIASIPMLSQIAYLRGSLLLHYIPKLPISQHLQVLQGSSGPRTDIKKRKNTNRSIDLSVRHKTSLLCVIFWKVIMHFFLELNIFSQWLQGISTPSTWCASICLMMSVASPSFQHTLQVLPSFCLFLILNFLWLFSIIDLTVSSKCCKSADTGIDMANALFSILLRSSICSFLVVPEYDIFWFVLYFCVCLVCISVSLD